jgi:hypothetical protein
MNTHLLWVTLARCALPFVGAGVFGACFLGAKGIRSRLARLLLGLALGLAATSIYYLTAFRWISYDYNPGNQHAYLTPLVFPYQLEAFDVKACAHIRVLDGETSVPDVGQIAVGDGVILGQHGNACRNDQTGWFILNTQDGSVSEYDSAAAFQEALRAMGIDSTAPLTPAEDYFDRYWNEH